MGRPIAPLPSTPPKPRPQQQHDETASELSSITNELRPPWQLPWRTASYDDTYQDETTQSNPPLPTEVLLPREKLSVVGISRNQKYRQGYSLQPCLFCRLLLPPWIRRAPPWLQWLVLTCLGLFLLSAVLIIFSVAWQLHDSKANAGDSSTADTWRSSSRNRDGQTQSVVPTVVPTLWPSEEPSFRPSAVPTRLPSLQPTVVPTSSPTRIPSTMPSSYPSNRSNESLNVTNATSVSEVIFTNSNFNSTNTTMAPSTSQTPSTIPSAQPSRMPSSAPTARPSTIPSAVPSYQPSAEPSRQRMGMMGMKATTTSSTVAWQEAPPTNFPTFARGTSWK